MLIFTDLDDTLFQTERKLHLKQKPQEKAENVVLEGTGVKPTFMLDHQKRMLDWLKQGNIIPVTGRDLRAFQAIQVQWGSHAVLNHGATVLVWQEGWKADPEWTQRMNQEARDYREFLHQAMDLLNQAHSDPDLMFHRIIHEGELPICTVSKVRNLPESALAEVRQQVQEKLGAGKYYIHLNGNNLSFVPDAVRKRHAVEHLIAKLNPNLTLGIGDSHTDLEFMQVCDFWMTPTHSQIQKLLEQHA
ncbi:HAD hydrolase family protein [Deinococcus cellulosilyticus]|uniref:Uncharacterized protein n=1 Tax=Deinococcus cellulosilyticus (strain DSM 18568 / NBRC 106333 / KACC 11606 / 5516J-15) TaxID=1223518 RepID=A0A511MUX5_DEIC1|nr:HAD hydrolase family protein [Deinococcus cellulosilyticus]GEM44400.1 hypothetical protein DC3_00350 [Deinococcus cellulosilyticus NBRC 106333 = KACC 11606]